MTHKSLIFLALIILLCAAASVTAESTSPPPIPCTYHGTVTINGVPAPVGTIIQTKVYGTVRGQEYVYETGNYDYLAAQVTADEYSCGCTITVEFYVNGYKAPQTSTFTAGGGKEVNLAVQGVIPTTSPTTSPTTTQPTTQPTTSPTTSPTTAVPTTSPTSPPSLPHSFYGTAVLANGENVPAGTQVSAQVAGVISPTTGNPVTMTVPGRYGVTSAGDLKLAVQGYISPNASIEFYIGGIRAECYAVNSSGGWQATYPFQSGADTELNLRTNMTVPHADFEAVPVYGYEPLIVQFYDRTTGYPTAWNWSFGDNSIPSYQQNPSHMYYNGAYNVTLTATNAAGSDTITKTTYIVVSKSSSPAGGGGGGGGGGGFYAPAFISSPTPNATVTPTPTQTGTGTAPGGVLPLNVDLVLSQSVVIVAEDNVGSLSLPEGMKPTDAAGKPLLTLTIARLPDGSVPPVPPGAGYVFAGYAYDIEPSGASFDPYITLSMTLPETEWAALQNRDLSIKWYNPSNSIWEDIPTTVNTNTRTISAKITHTSVYGLFAILPPQTAVTTVPTTVPTQEPFSAGGLALDLIIKMVIVIIIIIAAVVLVFYFLKKRKPAVAAAEPVEEDWDIQGLR
jgi:PKD repeat protein